MAGDSGAPQPEGGVETLCTKPPESIMSPLTQRTLESKNERRKRLMALPYPEKVRIVEQMRLAAGEVRAKARQQGLEERR